MPEKLAPTFQVGPVPVFGDLILSPMDGVTDLPFRVIARRLGSAMSYTEFINVQDILNGHPHVAERLRFLEEERPFAIQIYDDQPERMLEAARVLEMIYPNIIDVNMGCPAKTVSSRGAGAGLLKEPRKVAEIMTGLVNGLKVPVTAKIRLGWDEDSRNYLEIAHIIEDCGGQLLAVHGRTRMQNYKGRADWDAIAEIKQAVKIPVIGNGDVRTVADIQRIKQHTGCDAVMIGRGAIDNPWIFARRDREQVEPDIVQSTMSEHFEAMLDYYGESGLILFRKFAKRYLRPYELDPGLMLSLLTCETASHFRDLTENAFQSLAHPIDFQQSPR